MNRSFHWGTDKTPDWFNNLEHSYQFNEQTKEIILPTMEGNRIVSPGELVTEGTGGFFVIGDGTSPKPNRAQRRQAMKTEERLVVTRITVEFENHAPMELDQSKVMIIDKKTKAQLFDYVIENKSN